MNIIQVGCILGLIWSTHAGGKISEIRRTNFLELSEECKKEKNATDDIRDKLMDGKMPETTEGKCFSACVMERLLMFKKKRDGKMQGKMAFCEKCLDMLADVGEIPNDKLEILKDIGGVCNEVFHEDICEYGADFSKCVQEQAIKRKLDPETAQQYFLRLWE